MEYSPLVAERNEIRLVKVLPREDAAAVAAGDQQPEMIQCIMEHKSLDELGHTQGDSVRLEYVALSYCWGSWDDSQLIAVNGQVTKVTRNLYDFLKVMWEGAVWRWFWIDALCINQKNTDERNLQVKRMGSIYERARRVLAWLGASSEDGSTAIQLLQSTYEHGKTIAEDRRREELHLWLNERPVGSWCALFRLWSRQYWARLWIIQEIVLNHNLLVMCGADVIDWTFLSQPPLGCKKTSLICACDAKTIAVCGGTLLRLIAVRKCHGEARYDLGEIMISVRGSEQSDVKDRVYGILNLISPCISAQIEPNYRLSVQDVFTDFAKACITSTKGLEILRQARNNKTVNPKTKEYTDLTRHYPSSGDIFPTWVPDLRRGLENDNLKADIRYPTSSDTVANVRFMDLNCLIARGFRVDKVDGLGSCMKHDLSKRQRDRFIVRGLMEPSLKGQPVVQPTQELSQTPYHDKYGFRDALSKTLVAGWDSFTPDGALGSLQSLLDLPIFLPWEAAIGSLHNESFYRKFMMVCHCTQHLKIGGRPFSSYFSKHKPQTQYQSPFSRRLLEMLFVAESTLTTRRLLVTDKGYIGVVDHKAQKGDIIVVLYGSSVPLILRPRNEGGFILIGEAYVHGIMQGEAMEWLKNGDYELENFDIF